jgi:hypothetical protein
MVVGSFPDNTIPDGLISLVNGMMYISTIGWTRRSATYLLAILPITIITILTFACTLYSILEAWKDDSGYKTTFDVSNPLHLIMASAAGSLKLRDFNEEGIITNEGMEVQLKESDENGVKKKFVIVNQPDSVASKEELE